MNEEIDIVELLKRVKEGKAPKEIKIKEDSDDIFIFNPKYEEIGDLYKLKDRERIRLGIDAFNFDETDSQMQAIEEIKADMIKRSDVSFFGERVDQYIVSICVGA